MVKSVESALLRAAVRLSLGAGACALATLASAQTTEAAPKTSRTARAVVALRGIFVSLLRALSFKETA